MYRSKRHVSKLFDVALGGEGLTIDCLQALPTTSRSICRRSTTMMIVPYLTFVSSDSSKSPEIVYDMGYGLHALLPITPRRTLASRVRLHLAFTSGLAPGALRFAASPSSD